MGKKEMQKRDFRKQTKVRKPKIRSMWDIGFRDEVKSDPRDWPNAENFASRIVARF